MVVVVAAFLFAGAAAFVFPHLPSELTPSEDRGSIPISIRAPQGATVDYTTEQVRKAERLLQPFLDSGEVENRRTRLGFVFAAESW